MSTQIILFGAITLVGVASAIFFAVRNLIHRSKNRHSTGARLDLPKAPAGIRLATAAETLENFQLPSVTQTDHAVLDEFLKEYDAKSDLTFATVNYRKGARSTCAFGLSEGYVLEKDGKTMDWGYVRVHAGVDRAGGGQLGQIKDVVMAPFNFEASAFQDYKGVSFGTLVTLISRKYSFEFRIGHMHPQKNIVPMILQQLKAGAPISRDWLVGTAGTYGYSSGNHTHTEVKSTGTDCEVLEILLEEKFGNAILREYTSDDVVAFYKTQKAFMNKSPDVCLKDWAQQKKSFQIVFMNRYLFRRVYFDGKVHTWYNTWELFGL